MSDDDCNNNLAHARAHFAKTLGKPSSAQPARVLNAGDTPAPSPGEFYRGGPKEPRFVSGPKRELVPTGRTFGGKPSRSVSSYMAPIVSREDSAAIWKAYHEHVAERTARGESADTFTAWKRSPSGASCPPDKDGRTGVDHGKPAASDHAQSDAAGDAYDPVAEAESMLQDKAVQEAVMPHMAVFNAAMAELNEPAESVGAMTAWLTEFAAGRLPEIAEPHKYDGASKWRRTFQGYERSVFESFASTMWAAGISEAAMDNMVRVFMEMRRSKDTGELGRAIAGARRRGGK